MFVVKRVGSKVPAPDCTCSVEGLNLRRIRSTAPEDGNCFVRAVQKWNGRCLLPLPNAHFVPPFWDGKGMVVCMWQRNGPAQPNRALPFEPELSVQYGGRSEKKK